MDSVGVPADQGYFTHFQLSIGHPQPRSLSSRRRTTFDRPLCILSLPEQPNHQPGLPNQLEFFVSETNNSVIHAILVLVDANEIYGEETGTNLLPQKQGGVNLTQETWTAEPYVLAKYSLTVTLFPLSGSC
jgi:hypothetical protein